MKTSEWYYLLLNLIDGTVWLHGPMMIITMFFGFGAKTKGRVLKHMSIALLLYEIFFLILKMIVTKNGGQVGVINGVLVIFCIIYWTVNIENVKRIKSFFIVAMACEITTITIILNSSICGLLFDTLHVPDITRFGMTLAAPLVWNLVIFVFAKLSCKKRKEPMTMPLIIVTFLLFVLTDTILGLFGLEEGAYLQNSVFIRIIVDSKLGESSLSVGTFLLFVLMVVFSLLMIIKESESSYFRKKNAIDEYYLEAQKTHYESLMQSNREIRKIKHDMKNHLFVIRKLADEKNYEELAVYIKDLSDKFSKADLSIQVGNEIADAILSEKQQMAKSKGIELKVEGNMYGIEMSAIDTCTIFSNLIDNAIESVSMLDNRKWINLTLKKHNNYLVISETNPCKNRLEIVDNRIATTKKDSGNHGFGLINIKEAVQKYDGDVNLSINEAENGYEFTIEIVIAS